MIFEPELSRVRGERAPEHCPEGERGAGPADSPQAVDDAVAD
jgi:hypothetical protein